MLKIGLKVALVSLLISSATVFAFDGAIKGTEGNLAKSVRMSLWNHGTAEKFHPAYEMYVNMVEEKEETATETTKFDVNQLPDELLIPLMDI